MMMRKKNMLLSLVLLITAGCATVPTGPTVAVMPAPGKPLDLFQTEDVTCRQYAQDRTGIEPVHNNAAAGAVFGGIVGAGLGTIFSGGRGSGAAFGAATGALFGSAEGASADEYYGYQAQRQYDIAYQQCMYANGNMIPGMRGHYRQGPLPPPPDLGSAAPYPR